MPDDGDPRPHQTDDGDGRRNGELERGPKAHMDWLRATVTANPAEEAIAAIKKMPGIAKFEGEPLQTSDFSKELCH